MMLRFSALFAVVALYFCLAGYGQAQVPAKITEIQAMAFESRTGTLSENLLGAASPELGNMPTGRNASVSTFVIVKVEFGKDSPIPTNAKVRLIATESGSAPFSANPQKQKPKIILDALSDLGPADANGTTYVGFWLQRTGCRTIFLKATLSGAAAASSMNKVLPFTCYE